MVAQEGNSSAELLALLPMRVSFRQRIVLEWPTRSGKYLLCYLVEVPLARLFEGENATFEVYITCDSPVRD